MRCGLRSTKNDDSRAPQSWPPARLPETNAMAEGGEAPWAVFEDFEDDDALLSIVDLTPEMGGCGSSGEAPMLHG